MNILSMTHSSYNLCANCVEYSPRIRFIPVDGVERPICFSCRLSFELYGVFPEPSQGSTSTNYAVSKRKPGAE